MATATSKAIDYSVYLVTDSTSAILGTRDLCEVVESSLDGGVSVVQYRDKHATRDDFLNNSKKLLEVTKRHGVPLLINDRVDVAVEIGCEGAHVGQDDMEYEEARKMLGPNKIIGVSASTAAEAIKAAESGADYIGIGTVFATPTKKDTSALLGPSGLRAILESISKSPYPDIPTVCIGGIQSDNVAAILDESRSAEKSLDGVAVVSAIMSSPDPAAAARDMVKKVIVAKIPEVVRRVGRMSPLSHNMTNLVVQNFAANVALAIGASPIMANYGKEAADLAKLGGSLLINSGTVTPEVLEDYKMALKAYNEADRPVLLDPVGAGATSVRRNALQTLLSGGYFSLIKGNEGEILTVHSTTSSSQQKGVDSASTLSVHERARIVRDLARRHSNVILMTGKTDVLSNGHRTFRLDNGHEMLGMITGSGCTLGTTLSAMLATVSKGDALLAALAGSAMYEIAAERAAAKGSVEGPGTFVPAFIDALYAIKTETQKGDMSWMKDIKMDVIDLSD